jgi:hypothetical protein
MVRVWPSILDLRIAMKQIKLLRVSHSLKLGTYGVMLKEDEEPICNSLELPWRNNLNDISCIPAGDYRVIWEAANRARVLEVPKRVGVLIHSGNWITEILGCILPAMRFSYADEHSGVHESMTAMKQLRAATDEEFLLRIRWSSETMALAIAMQP